MVRGLCLHTFDHSRMRGCGLRLAPDADIGCTCRGWRPRTISFSWQRWAENSVGWSSGTAPGATVTGSMSGAFGSQRCLVGPTTGRTSGAAIPTGDGDGVGAGALRSTQSGKYCVRSARGTVARGQHCRCGGVFRAHRPPAVAAGVCDEDTPLCAVRAWGGPRALTSCGGGSRLVVHRVPRTHPSQLHAPQ